MPGSRMPKRYVDELRDDAVRQAHDRPQGVTINQVAKEFGVHPMTLQRWLRIAEEDRGQATDSPGADTRDLREALRRVDLLERENATLRRATFNLSEALVLGSEARDSGPGRARRDP